MQRRRVCQMSDAIDNERLCDIWGFGLDSDEIVVRLSDLWCG